MKEQPDDLFKWGDEHSPASREVQSSRKDENPLDWCPQCDLLGHFCPHHEKFAPENQPESVGSSTENVQTVDIETANEILQMERHSAKRKDEIPLEEFIAGLNETQSEINKRQAS